MEIIDYTEKSIAVRGDTKQYKDLLTSIGGKWNTSLTDKSTNEKFAGWIFQKSKREYVTNELNKIISKGPLIEKKTAETSTRLMKKEPLVSEESDDDIPVTTRLIKPKLVVEKVVSDAKVSTTPVVDETSTTLFSELSKEQLFDIVKQMQKSVEMQVKVIDSLLLIIEKK